MRSKRRGARPETVAALIAAATLGAAAAVAMAAVLSGRRVRRARGDALWRVLDSLMRWLAVVSVAGIVWAGAAVAFVAACAR